VEITGVSRERRRVGRWGGGEFIALESLRRRERRRRTECSSDQDHISRGNFTQPINIPP
jgi:hypothetical protein